MKTKSYLPLLVLLSTFGGMLNSSHTSLFEADVTFFSLHILMLEKNVLRVERYGLHELNEGDNYLTRKTSNAHCSYVLNLGERGMHVSSLGFNVDQPSMLNVSAYRGKNAVQYLFDWAKLLMSDPAQAHPAMHAQVVLKEVDQVFAESEEIKRGRWQSSASLSWGTSDKHEMNLIFERGLESVVAVVVPNILCKDIDNEIKIMKKNELEQAGLLKRLDNQMLDPMAETIAQVEQESQEVVRANKDACCPYVNSCVDTQDSCADSCQCSSWLSHAYTAAVAKLAALKQTVYSYCGC